MHLETTEQYYLKKALKHCEKAVIIEQVCDIAILYTGSSK